MKVVVISGGASPEHQVSLASGRGISKAVELSGHTAIPLVIDAQGNWNDGLFEAISLLQDSDVVVPALHGEGGEDGVLQGFLDQLQVPYVGSGVAASAVGLDKHLTKAPGIAVPADVGGGRDVLRRGDREPADHRCPEEGRLNYDEQAALVTSTS
ncbi:hypothetical protein [Kribbella catacumbae]|uniref:hypothetical protein n=1 Tax=Kribbella catacumbae TaxID=460086 RepID=UPI000376FC64|nr:hypothetical protein [Kribbella catacumbae]